ncbi:TerC family protein [Metabacillus indicus]|uniref:TerC family protein n=1 Tax=Metabacillus indicus TaxID=246786 RepID=UPI003CEC0337
MEQEFLMSLVMIIGIDLLLGGDNAIVIAMASRNLPPKQRKKAVVLGTVFAIVVRILLTTVAVYLFQIPFVQLIGGILLLYIAYHLIVGSEEKEGEIKSHQSLRKAVQTIVAADMLMGMDNVIAVAGAAGGKTVLVVIGLLISIPIMIWGSNLILKLLDKYPALVYIGGGMLAYTAGKMIIHEHKLASIFHTHPSMGTLLPYLLILFLTAAGFIYQRMEKKENLP